MSASRGEFAAVGGSDLCWSDLAIDDVPAELHRQFDGEHRRFRRAFVENGRVARPRRRSRPGSSQRHGCRSIE
ncbi:hypothetical protein FPJ27_05075 [Burkholderia sp. MS455]|uniref:hypothetical protein n=1 Tax=Burkholderia sp. MS455 TaxID=2811788 RepID=UPI00195CE091|nr:hypothetical protein [Burkholderia sp. MS455]QRR05859.1 hypothetical protein FPJ27_05075 [Burkholderia sp. MS455]